MLRDASKPVLWHEISSTGSDQERHEPLHVQARTEAVQIRVQRVSTAVQKWAAPRRRITCVDAAWTLQGSESRLTRFGTEDCLHVGAVPPCHFPAQLEAHCLRFGAWFGPSFQGRSRRGWHVGSGPDEVEGEMAHDGHVVGAVPQND